MNLRSLISFLLLPLAGCATLTGGAEQEITVATTPAGANCLLNTSAESWTIEQTPASVQVTRALEPLSITCTLAGYQPAHILIESKTRGRAYGNILLGGIPAYVDAGTGKGYEYSPNEVTLTLEPVAAATQ